MRVLIFTEGGKQIGLGHISRCSSLYDEIESRFIEVKFIINGNKDEIKNIGNRNVKFTNWLSKKFLYQYIQNDDYCIVDSYLADKNLYEVISNKSKNCIFIDDNARIKYPKGIIVNPSLNPYKLYDLDEDNNYYLIGQNYIILRKSFVSNKRKFINSEVKEVLITMGGSDIRELTSVILKQLCNIYNNIIFNVVVGNSSMNLTDIEISDSKNINFYSSIDAEKMKDIMFRSDIAITAAGQTIYELLATQTPFIAIKVINNQENNVNGLMNMKLISTVLDYEHSDFLDELEKEFKRLLNTEERVKMYNSYFSIIDGFGSKRIVNALIQKYHVKYDLYLRKVMKNDIEKVFKLSNEDYVRKYSINKNKIKWEKHLIWFNNILKSEENIFYVVTDISDNFLGQIRYNIEGYSAIVSISLCKSIIGKGLSSILLKFSIELLKKEKKEIKNVIAFVSNKNIASEKLFSKTGFQLYEENDGMLEYHYIINEE